MSERNHNGSKMFLTELIFAIFFFSIITAICVQFFAGAYAMSKHSKELTQSVNVAANVAEYYTVWDFEHKSWDELFPEGKWNGDNWHISYNEQWKPCSDEGDYMLDMKIEQVDSLQMAYIVVTDKQDNELYSLEVKRLRGE